jgi:hypothetical protein
LRITPYRLLESLTYTVYMNEIPSAVAPLRSSWGAMKTQGEGSILDLGTVCRSRPASCSDCFTVGRKNFRNTLDICWLSQVVRIQRKVICPALPEMQPSRTPEIQRNCQQIFRAVLNITQKFRTVAIFKSLYVHTKLNLSNCNTSRAMNFNFQLPSRSIQKLSQ